MILRTWRSPQPRPVGWLWVGGFVLLLTWGINLVSMVGAVIWGGSAWVLLILLPALGSRQIQSFIDRQQYQKAYQWAIYLRVLHPFDGWWEQPDIIRALVLGQRGQISQGKQILRQYKNHQSFLARQAIAQYYAMQFDWEGLLGWLRARELKTLEPLLLVYYCRALGETGQLASLLDLLSAPSTQAKLTQGGDRHYWHQVLLFAAAFCGEVKTLEQLLAENLKHYPPQIRSFWGAIAQYAAGNGTQGQAILQMIQQETDPSFRNAVTIRLQHPPRLAQKLIPRAAYPQLVRLSRLVQQENQERLYQSLVGGGPSPITNLLVVVNCLVFFGAIAWGFPSNPEAVLQGGGFIPDQVLQGQWWRFFTANFIHVGIAHLLMNMVTLSLLGPFAEKHLGRSRYLLVYLGSGLGATVTLFGLVLLAQNFDYATFSGVLLFFTREIRHSYQVWVGASGSIMGIMGAIAVILWQGWQRHHIEAAGRQFRLISLIIVIQFIVDLSSPNVSFYSHFLGLCWGIFLTRWLFSSRRI
ncbi:rhomboid family intramembrane serine protease [Picosynechococcus sp. NKBG15041c]|uniref:rhomboid family intramembrane serine protease n=1 Tax=Picosynechococcus sp. NKBG15041c TaxID=1407650 RepID=UPI00040B4540|nr:rhomboid family intramembrane serine protease [Picosynechococcus sp. NKBG15041c]